MITARNAPGACAAGRRPRASRRRASGSPALAPCSLGRRVPAGCCRSRNRIAPTALNCSAGPERIESGWWDGADVARDYYLARDAQGARQWVFRDLRSGRGTCTGCGRDAR